MPTDKKTPRGQLHTAKDGGNNKKISNNNPQNSQMLRVEDLENSLRSKNHKGDDAATGLSVPDNNSNRRRISGQQREETSIVNSSTSDRDIRRRNDDGLGGKGKQHHVRDGDKERLSGGNGARRDQQGCKNKETFEDGYRYELFASEKHKQLLEREIEATHATPSSTTRTGPTSTLPMVSTQDEDNPLNEIDAVFGCSLPPRTTTAAPQTEKSSHAKSRFFTPSATVVEAPKKFTNATATEEPFMKVSSNVVWNKQPTTTNEAPQVTTAELPGLPTATSTVPPPSKVAPPAYPSTIKVGGMMPKNTTGVWSAADLEQQLLKPAQVVPPPMQATLRVEELEAKLLSQLPAPLSTQVQPTHAVSLRPQAPTITTPQMHFQQPVFHTPTVLTTLPQSVQPPPQFQQQPRPVMVLQFPPPPPQDQLPMMYYQPVVYGQRQPQPQFMYQQNPGPHPMMIPMSGQQFQILSSSQLQQVRLQQPHR